jgi:hypothetical protein
MVAMRGACPLARGHLPRPGKYGGENMEYETAKALKGAGFPQAMRAGDACYLSDSEEIIITQRQIQGNAVVNIFCRDTLEQMLPSAPASWVKVPSLSELIKACENVKGYHLFCLEHPREGWLATMADDSARAPLETYASGGYRSTPEAAVARLWLELQATTAAHPRERRSRQLGELSVVGGSRLVRPT